MIRLGILALVAVLLAAPPARAPAEAGRAARDSTVTVAGWNVWVPNGLRDVRRGVRAMRAYRPAVIGITEASRYRGKVRPRGYARWWPCCTKARAEAPQFMRRRTYSVRDRWVLAMDRRWSYNGRKPPRRYTVTEGRHRPSGCPIVTVNVHLPTGGPDGRNARAWRESARKIRRLIRRHPRPVVFVVGDFNGNRRNVHAWIPNGFVQTAGVIDHLVVSPGSSCSAWSRSTTRLPRYGSDHHAWIYRTGVRRR